MFRKITKNTQSTREQSEVLADEEQRSELAALGVIWSEGSLDYLVRCDIVLPCFFQFVSFSLFPMLRTPALTGLYMQLHTYLHKTRVSEVCCVLVL